MASLAEMRRGVTRGGTVSRAAFGISGTANILGRISGEDYNPLFEPALGMALFDQMERSDAQCGAAVDIVRLPILAARYRAIPPDEATTEEKAITDSVNRWIFESGAMIDTWQDTLRHLLMKVYMGFSFVEKIFTWEESEGIVRFARLAPRLPRSVIRFEPMPDGQLKSIVQRGVEPGTGKYIEPEIPAFYAALVTRNKEGDNFWGRSVLRRAYKHWWYKDEAYRIDGVRLDRYGVGIPVAKIGEGHPVEGDELNEIENTLIALRSHDSAYIIEPAKVDFRIMVPEGKGGADGLMESVAHHDSMILRAVLATFMADHSEGLNTNRTATLADVFMKALKGEAGEISSCIERELIRPFCDLNFDMTVQRYPGVEITGLGDLTLEQLKEAIPAFANAKLLTPTDDVESRLRVTLGLDPLPDGWQRGEEAPELPTTDVQPSAELQVTENPDDKAIESLAQSLVSLGQDFNALRNEIAAGAVKPDPKRKAKRIVRDASGRITGMVEVDPREFIQ
jgi:phage gp29-like protein